MNNRATLVKKFVLPQGIRAIESKKRRHAEGEVPYGKAPQSKKTARKRVLRNTKKRVSPTPDREIEVKILDIDIKKTVSKLKKLGAKKISEHFYKRIILDLPDNQLDKKHAWLRLRSDGKKTTLTYKKVHNQKIDGKEEQEVIVGDFEKTRKILKALGFEERRFQESRRVMFELDGVEVDIDFWPKIPPYMEVEAKTKKKLVLTLKKIGIELKDTTTETPRKVYKRYGINLDDYRRLMLEKNKKVMKI